MPVVANVIEWYKVLLYSICKPIYVLIRFHKITDQYKTHIENL